MTPTTTPTINGLEKAAAGKNRKRAKGWYVADQTTGMCHGGPYKHSETAVVARELHED